VTSTNAKGTYTVELAVNPSQMSFWRDSIAWSSSLKVSLFVISHPKKFQTAAGLLPLPAAPSRYAPSYGGGIVTSIVYWTAAAPAGVDSVMI
jgi:hypothetical protein